MLHRIRYCSFPGNTGRTALVIDPSYMPAETEADFGRRHIMRPLTLYLSNLCFGASRANPFSYFRISHFTKSYYRPCLKKTLTKKIAPVLGSRCGLRVPGSYAGGNMILSVRNMQAGGLRRIGRGSSINRLLPYLKIWEPWRLLLSAH